MPFFLGQAPDTTRADETIGFIVIEAGHTSIDGVGFEALPAEDIVRGIDNAPALTCAFRSALAGTIGGASQRFNERAGKSELRPAGFLRHLYRVPENSPDGESRFD